MLIDLKQTANITNTLRIL